jgi:hypothetical protein
VDAVLCTDATSSPVAPPISDPDHTWLQFPLVFSSVSQVREGGEGTALTPDYLSAASEAPDSARARPQLPVHAAAGRHRCMQDMTGTGVLLVLLLYPACHCYCAAVPQLPLVPEEVPVQSTGHHQVRALG